MTASRVRVAAHRGGALLWPENSLRAFRESIALGCDLLELDVHPTADGAVAVLHDPTLERTSDARGAVAALPARALRGLRLRGPDGALSREHVPTLDEVLALVAPSPAGLLVEVKGPEPGVAVDWQREGGRVRWLGGPRYPGLEKAVVDALHGAGLLARSSVMAFNPAVLAAVRALAPAARTTLLVAAGHVEAAGARPEDTIEWTQRVGATEAGLQHTLATPAVVRAARAAGLSIGVWTVNDEAAMRRVTDLGVDAVTSDRPDLLLRVLGRGR